MHIGLDLTSLMRYRSGVDTATRELVLSLARLDGQNQYTLFLNREDLAEFRGSVPPSFRLLGWSTRNRAVRAFVQQAAWPAACACYSIDILHSLAFLTPLYRAGSRHLLTLHDLTFFSHPRMHSPLHRSRIFRQALTSSARRADMINVPSEATRQAILKLWPDIPRERIRLTPWGIGSDFHPAPPAEIERHRLRLGLPCEFILFAGTLEPRKNLNVLIEAYRRLIRDTSVSAHLVFAGRPGWGFRPTLALLDAPELRSRTHCLGFVAQEDLPWVYRAARLFVYPSIYEGFGFPPLEAMACGVPVIASRGSALEVNLHDAAELTVPGDPEMLESAMRRVLSETAGAAHARIQNGMERTRRFSWTNTAQMVLDCYRELSEPCGGSLPRRRRILPLLPPRGTRPES